MFSSYVGGVKVCFVSANGMRTLLILTSCGLGDREIHEHILDGLIGYRGVNRLGSYPCGINLIPLEVSA